MEEKDTAAESNEDGSEDQKSSGDWLTSEVQEAGPCRKLIEATVASTRVREELESSFKELKLNVIVPGFRKGKAPRKLLERKFGEEVKDQVQEKLRDEAFLEVLEKENLEAVGEPEFAKLELSEDETLTFEVTVEVKPDFKLGDYKGLKLEKPSEKVTEKDVEEAIEALRLRNSELVTEEGRKVKEGDTVLGEWRVAVGENVLSEEKEILVPVAKGKVLGVEVDLPKVLKKAKAGDEKSTTINLPEDFENSEFAGREAEILIKIKEVKVNKLPELDDEFAKTLGLDSIDALKEQVEKHVEARKKAASRESLEVQAFDKLLEDAEFDIPEGLLDREAHRMKDDMRRRLRFRGVPPKVVEERLEEMGDSTKDETRKRIKSGFVMDKIAEVEKITATEDEVQNLIESLAADSGQKSADVRKRMEESGMIGNLRTQIRREKSIQLVLDKAETTEEKK